MIEIERRFLVSRVPEGIYKSLRIEQFYTPNDENQGVRIRHTIDSGQSKYHLTVKRPKSVMSNYEHEIEIPEQIFHVIRKTATKRLSKTRLIVPHDDLIFEVDIFDDHEIIIAEVELTSEDQKVSIPDWIDTEITGISKFSSYALAMPI